MVRFLLITLLLLPAALVSGQETGGANRSTNTGAGKIIFSPGFFLRNERRTQGDQSIVNTTLIDVRLGYQFNNNWYGGIIYGWESEKIEADDFPVSGVNRNSLSQRTAYGISGGYVYGSYYAMLNYLPFAEWNLEDFTTKIKYSKAWGAQFDIGINFELFPTFLLGPRLSYKYWQFSERDTGSGSTSIKPKLERYVIDPYFAIWAEF